LGNVRLSYGRDPQAHNEIKILEENHYYPYGLKHTNYNANLNAFKKDNNDQVQLTGTGLSADLINKYKFNGMEYQDELGLNLYDMDFRDYDPAIGRWLGIDPVTHFSQSPYNAFDGNPVSIADPSGADGIGGSTSYSSFGMTYESPNSSGMNNGYNIGSAFGAFHENVGAAWGDGGLLAEQNVFRDGNNIFMNWDTVGENGKFRWNARTNTTSIWHEDSVTYNGKGNNLDTVNLGYWETIFSSNSAGLGWTLKFSQLVSATAGEFHSNPTKAANFAELGKRLGFWGDLYSVINVADDFSNPAVSRKQAEYNAAYSAFSIFAATRAGVSLGGLGGALVGVTLDLAPAALNASLILWNQSVYAISGFTVNFRGYVR
jgi:RHS repeat-associated protein